MSVSPDWLLFLPLCSLKVTDVAEDRHVVHTDSSPVPQQVKGFTAEHRPAQLIPPLGHSAAGKDNLCFLLYNDVHNVMSFGCLL